MPTLSANGLTLAYETHGQGRPLVLIAGVGYGAWFWRWVIPDLARRYRVIVFDNRGAGGSDKPDGPYTVPMLAADATGLLDGLGITGACVLGHSLGGFVAQELAVLRPDLVGRLILASTNHGGMNVVPITPEALKVLTDRSGDPGDLIRRGIDIATAPGWAKAQPGIVQELIDYRLTNPVPPPQYAAQVLAGAGMAQLSDAQVKERLAALTMPALILFGEHDRVVPPGNAGLLAGKMPDARVVLLPGVGHIFPIEDPGATVRAVTDFLG
jgi:pimeloyl-ACP methyl ester carboxylesterase